eukprot:CAMPEP_0197654190 /NCGR_PEP_ID=MMETSP1338-20131121/38704_1 /TAXON_ID=43686 ORGANISM="Pelagodinium beii, Strain RCC1491" /NCGR_SAMPLE_ID=MMETSP1338 /ASSEMBLY_ACC=CAM_ASM_000754 /LENGTH=190 /DNA_ID=CAMNT_0043229589 /DNA_START=30 /DNA_END=602 /DNA_ORIENTATION=+
MAVARRRPTKVLAALLPAAALLVLSGRLAFSVPGASPSRRNAVGQMLQITAAAVAGQTVMVDPVWAAARWSGSYNDPKHPGCQRKITKKKDVFIISGTSSTDGNKGCAEGAKVKKWELLASLPESTDFLAAPAKELIIDFSPKGGPKDAVATWTGDGILFPDGNKWTKKVSNEVPALNSYNDYTRQRGTD